jgi:hypothetical protein
MCKEGQCKCSLSLTYIWIEAEGKSGQSQPTIGFLCRVGIIYMMVKKLRRSRLILMK